MIKNLFRCLFSVKITGPSLMLSGRVPKTNATVFSAHFAGGFSAPLLVSQGADFRERTGKSLNDQQLVEIAAHFLKRALEAGDSVSVPLFLDGESLMKLAREFGPL